MKRYFLFGLLAIAALSSNAVAGQVRSQSAISDFKQLHPCPANGSTKGSCPGYVIDHVEPLACGGPDTPANMQWQTTADSKAKDKWERSDCGLMAVKGRRSSSSSSGKRRHSTGRSGSSGGGSGGGLFSAPSNGNYHLGPRGGCYTLSGSGKKQYVDHSYCS